MEQDKVRVLLINSNDQTVSEMFIDRPLTLNKGAQIIKCDNIDYFIDYFANSLYADVDHYENNMKFFKIKDIDSDWFGGIGLLVGNGYDYDDEPVSCDCNLDLNVVRSSIKWMQVDDQQSKQKLFEHEDDKDDELFEDWFM